jgi:xanthine dehydrogenase/oxidase
MATPVEALSFSLNGEQVILNRVDANVTLNEWIRSQNGLTGTKKMCGEGGCGCCVVSVKRTHPVTQEPIITGINSCLCPLYSVEGWEITTVEGIGSASAGYHPIQKQLTQCYGSQCGYCTPGFVMNMYSFLQNNPNPSKQEIEDIFDGNICRCTGYRPILYAMKTFANNGGKRSDLLDIEDLSRATKWCSKEKRPCKGKCSYKQATSETTGTLWFRPKTIADVFTIFSDYSGKKVKLIVGDTGRGIFKYEAYPDVIVDLKSVSSLWEQKVGDSSVLVGACVTLAQLIEFLQTNSDKSSSFKQLSDHLLRIANVPVRNAGSWAGNLMLTHNNDNFPSDVYTIMEAAGATVTIATSPTDMKTYTLSDFLQVSMTTSLIVSMEIPFLKPNERMCTYKVMPRFQNAHAYVNAGFRIQFDPSSFTVTTPPTLVFGGIAEHGVTAAQTASYLNGKVLTDKDTLRNALTILEKELVPNEPPVATSPKYRKTLACSLFYKFYLSCVIDKVDVRVKSAGVPYVRPLSSGQQSYDSVPAEYPVTEPMPKLSALQQTSGEAVYTTDIPTTSDLLHGAFVLAPQGNAKIVSVDTSAAQTMPGFVRYISAADIPPNGENNSLPSLLFPYPEKVFTDEALYAGQSVGMVLADTHDHAIMAARAVKVNCQSLGPPILNIQEAIAKNSFFEDPDPLKVGDAEGAIAQAPNKISGEVSCGTQYHFTMETQTSLVIPEEDGYTVYPSTQWIQVAQSSVAMILGIPNSSVNVSVKRVGGAYGSKISRSHIVTAACALGAHVTGKPVCVHLDIDTNMKMVGKRYSYFVQYETGCDANGVISGIKMNIYNDGGCSNNDQEMFGYFYPFIDNAYNIPNWLLLPKGCKTNTPSNTWCRAPGSVPATFIIETLLEHVGQSLGLSYEQVRFANMYSNGDVTPLKEKLLYCNVKDIWKDLLESADVKDRQLAVEQYNKANRWRKRGLAVVPIKFPLDWNNAPFTVFVSIYAVDGTVAIAHAGIEIGQGINVKVAQAAAKTLGIPLDYVKIKPSNSLSGPNSQTTGGSIGSELNVMGVVDACEILNDRIAPVKKKMGGNPPWKDLIQQCYDDRVDLSAKACVNESTERLFQYFAYGTGCVETEIDVLTGETQVLRADILYDCGQSINPGVDIGQVEGAFVMGLGYWLTEDVKYDPNTGELLTHNTWEYKPPSSKDIPIDFRVALLKNAPNPVGVLGSKASGEPPQCMSSAIMFALKRSIFNARDEIGNKDFFALSGPATVDAIQQTCLVDSSQFYF